MDLPKTRLQVTMEMKLTIDLPALVNIKNKYFE